MARGGHVEDGKARFAVLQRVEDGRHEIARVQRPRLARLQVDLYAVGLLHPGDAALQRGQVVIRAGDVVPAAKIQPLHLRQQVAETRLHGVQRCGQRVGVLLAEGVEVQPVQQREQGGIFFRCGVPLGAGGAKAAAGGTGVIDGVALLCGALRVDAQPHALARSLGGGAELFQLAGRVEDDMVGAAQQLVEFVGPERGTEDMIFLVRQLLLAEAALVQAAGLGAREVRGQQRVEVEV